MILQIAKKTQFVQSKNRETLNLEPEPREMRELRVPFRVFPAKGKPGCYTILFASSYRTKYGFYDVLGEAIPEEVAILVLQSVHEKMKSPEPINLHNEVSVRCAMLLTGADVWGRRDATWWHDLASEESVLEGNGGEADGYAFRVSQEVWKNQPWLK